MKAASLSVVVPAYNAARTLPALIEALDAQTLRPLEIVVVDDRSDDETASVAEKLGAKVVRLSRRSGPGPARNAGVEACRGEVVAFTDADCVPPPTWLERALSFMAARGVRLTTSGYLGPVERDLSSWFQHWEKRSREPFTPEDIRATNGHSLVIERQLYVDEGGMEDLRTSEDFLFGLKLSRENPTPFDPENGVFHRFRPGLGGFVLQKLRFAQNSLRCVRTVPLELTRVATFSPLRVLLDLALTTSALVLAVLSLAAGLWTATALALLAAAAALAAARVAPFLVFLARQRGLGPAPPGEAPRPQVPPLLFLYSPPLLLVRDLAFMVGLALGAWLLLTGEPVRLNPRRDRSERR